VTPVIPAFCDKITLILKRVTPGSVESRAREVGSKCLLADVAEVLVRHSVAVVVDVVDAFYRFWVNQVVRIVAVATFGYEAQVELDPEAEAARTCPLRAVPVPIVVIIDEPPTAFRFIYLAIAVVVVAVEVLERVRIRAHVDVIAVVTAVVDGVMTIVILIVVRPVVAVLVHTVVPDFGRAGVDGGVFVVAIVVVVHASDGGAIVCDDALLVRGAVPVTIGVDVPCLQLRAASCIISVIAGGEDEGEDEGEGEEGEEAGDRHFP